MNKIKNFSLCLTVFFFFLNIFTINDGHNWGGDFSQYIIHAQNILQHRPYHSHVMLDLSVVYPPGFPLFLAPLIKSFGVNFQILKFPNIFFWYMSIVCFYPIFLRILGCDLAWLCCLVLSSSSAFFIFKQNVLSDVPFTFLMAAALYGLMKYEDYKENGSVYSQHIMLFLSAVTLACSLLTRSIGLTLYMASFVYFIFVKRDGKALGWLTVSLMGVFSFQMFLIGFNPGYTAKMLNGDLFSLASIIRQSFVPLRSIVLFFCPMNFLVTKTMFVFFEKFIIAVSPFFYSIIMWVFFKRIKTKTLSLVSCFFFFYLFVLIIWSGLLIYKVNDHGRFIFPLAASALLLGVTAIRFIMEKFARPASGLSQSFLKGFLLFLVVINSLDIFVNFGINDDVLYIKENQELFSWVKDNLQPDEHYMFCVPNTMALMTGRVGTGPIGNPIKQSIHLEERVKKFNISHLITVKVVDQDLIKLLEAEENLYKLVWENKDFKIFKTLYLIIYKK